jgi:hypothetical protein
MPYVTIDSRDGGFRIQPMSDEDADKRMQQGDDPILIDDSVYTAWLVHQNQHSVFNTLWRTLQNNYSEKKR